VSEIALESEKQLEDYLYGRMSGGDCVITGGAVDQVYRQFDLGVYGFIDLVGFYRNEDDKTITMTIYELKKDTLKCAHYAQISRYKTGFDKLIEIIAFDFGYSLDFEYILIGSDIDHQNDAGYLGDTLDWLNIYTFSIDMHTGIDFSHQDGWHREGEEFEKQIATIKRMAETDG